VAPDRPGLLLRGKRRSAAPWLGIVASALTADDDNRILPVTDADDVLRAELRNRFLVRTRSGRGVDFEALTEVHEHGWTHGVRSALDATGTR
jgi:hypothetical protein